jgi:hypothetical protein
MIGGKLIFFRYEPFTEVPDDLPQLIAFRKHLNVKLKKFCFEILVRHLFVFVQKLL